MVNRQPNEFDKIEIELIIEETETRALHAERAGKPDCAKLARTTVHTLEGELDRRIEERKKLFDLGAAAVLSETGI